MKDSDRPVISVLGDGDFMQGVSALWTAAHYSLPALYIVSNNRSNFHDELHQKRWRKSDHVLWRIVGSANVSTIRSSILRDWHVRRVSKLKAR